MQERGRIINKFADLLEEHTDELAALDSCAAVPVPVLSMFSAFGSASLAGSPLWLKRCIFP